MKLYEHITYKIYFLAVALTIIIFVSVLSYIGIVHTRTLVYREMESQAKALFNSIILARKWNSSYDGVYVKVDSTMKSDSYLPDSTIVTKDGVVYAKKVPAVMTREISEIADREGLFKYNLTSLTPINPDNMPTEFERQALLSFARGVKEVSTIDEVEGTTVFKFIAPLYVEKSCLKCHSHQGYKIGDVRGGMTIISDISSTKEDLRKSFLVIIVLAILSAALLISIIGYFSAILMRKLSDVRATLLRDITVRKETEKKLLVFKKVVDTIELGVTISDKEGKIIYTNPTQIEMYGKPVENLIGQKSNVFAPPTLHKASTADVISEMKNWKRESTNLDINGVEYPVQLISTSVKDDAGDPIGLVTISEDITERKSTEDQLKHLATVDSLTECYNRRYFFELGDIEIARSIRYNRPMSVLLLDIDCFKKINDTYGHPAGDEVLKVLSETCKANLRESDIFGRLGGEEFAIVLLEASMDEALEHAERIRDAIAQIQVPQNNSHISFTVSIGVSTRGAEDKKLGQMIKSADDALYKAKSSGRNCVKSL